MTNGDRFPAEEAVEELEIELRDVEAEGVVEGGALLRFDTSRGPIRAVFHEAADPVRGVVWVGDVGGGFDGPASSYHPLSLELLRHRCSSLRLDFREGGHLEESVLDTLVGVEFLAATGVARIGLCGWSFGGAVVITAGAVSDRVSAVATVASQSADTEMVSQLSPRPVLFLHGEADETLPPACSVDLYRRARDPKELKLYPGANHDLDQARDDLIRTLVAFVLSSLPDPSGGFASV